MTSQLKVDRISPATGSEIIIDGLDIPEPTESPIKAWVNFNGTGTVAIRDSMNVSSITDNGTGDYTVNFTTAMPDANYAVTAASFHNSTSGSAIAVSDYTTSSVRIRTTTHISNPGAFMDQNPISVVVTGN